MSLETRTKLQQGIKGVLNYCKLKIVFKWQTRVSNSVPYKDPTPKDFIPGVVYKFQCCLCNDSYYGEIIRHLDIRSQEHISVSVLLTSLYEVAKTCYNVATTSANGCVGAF